MLRKAQIPAILWTLFIASSCLLPASAFRRFTIDSIFQVDKLVHFILYAFFVLFWALTWKEVTRKKVLILAVIAIGYGVLIEILQSEMSLGRAYDLGDIIANTIGSILGLLSISLVNRKMPLLKKYLPFLRYLY